MKVPALIVIVLVTLSLTQIGCDRFTTGAATGAVGAGAAYEWQQHRQMEALEEDWEAGRITEEEYEARKEQIEQGSLIQ